MELSILIPVYNQHIASLCASLHKQATQLNTNFQILFLDDCSDLSISYINMKVNQLSNVNYKVLTENIGRAAIRNKLFELAKYDFCIIMDGDVSIIEDDYLENYLKLASEDVILVGGHVYHPEAPKDQSLFLHWFYGTQVESKTASERQKNPYHSFMTSNFACYKSTFEKIRFEEELRQYGHEDTLFGIKAAEQHIVIKHIENPVRHDGLDQSEIFLSKQKQAVQNLKRLYSEEKYRTSLQKHIALIKVSRWPIPWFIIELFSGWIHKNLTGKTPKIWCLQWQKLLWWHKTKN